MPVFWYPRAHEFYSVTRIRTWEEQAQKQGLTERLLIENASSNLSVAVDTFAPGKKVFIIAGCGNNGADVLACGRKLAGLGYRVTAALVREPGKACNAEAAFQKKILARFCQVHVLAPGARTLTVLARGSDFVLDGLFGIGLRGIVSVYAQRVIEEINGLNKPVIACDVPSGLNAQTGKPSPVAVRAAYTVTFIAAKKGFAAARAKQFCGTIVVTGVGIPHKGIVC